VVSMAGALLAAIGFLNTVQRRPKDRYAWGSALTRKLGGLLLVVLGLTSSGRMTRIKMSWYTWLIPTIAFVFAAVTLVNQVLLALSVRDIQAAEEAEMAAGLGKGFVNPGPITMPEPPQPPHDWQVSPFLRSYPKSHVSSLGFSP